MSDDKRDVRSIVEVIRHPLGFFALAALLIEAILLVVAWRATEHQSTILTIGMLVAFAIVLAVVCISIFFPSVVQGLVTTTPRREEKPLLGDAFTLSLEQHKVLLKREIDDYLLKLSERVSDKDAQILLTWSILSPSPAPLEHIAKVAGVEIESGSIKGRRERLIKLGLIEEVNKQRVAMTSRGHSLARIFDKSIRRD